MPTFATLKSNVAKRLLDASNVAVSEADVGTAINDAIKYYKYKRFWFNEFKEDVTLTASSRTVPQPSTATMLLPFQKGGLTITYSDIKYTLQKVTTGEYDNVDNGSLGIPEIYCRRAAVYDCYYIPDQAYTATWRGLKDYAELSTSTSENDFTTYADQMIVYNALSRLHGELRQDEKMESYYSARAGDEYNRLVGDTNRINATGALEIETL